LLFVVVVVVDVSGHYDEDDYVNVVNNKCYIVQ
jgi:hypothetical protein